MNPKDIVFFLSEVCAVIPTPLDAYEDGCIAGPIHAHPKVLGGEHMPLTARVYSSLSYFLRVNNVLASIRNKFLKIYRYSFLILSTVGCAWVGRKKLVEILFSY